MPSAFPVRAVIRRYLSRVVLGVCALLLVRTFLLEAFRIPTGSMAPTLLGQHHTCTCPRCGLDFEVGRRPRDDYRKAFCPNCGQQPVAVGGTAPISGDQVLVNKTAFFLRPPHRWEIVVLRLFGAHFIKRIVGLPGDELLVHDGDVYVNGRLARKTFEEAWPARILVHDQAHAPNSSAWAQRWERQPSGVAASEDPSALAIDGRATPSTLTYRHSLADTHQASPIEDDVAFNAGTSGRAEAVHDFLFEADVEIEDGRGGLVLRICDGGDWAEVEIPVDNPVSSQARNCPLQPKKERALLGTSGPGVVFRGDRRYHVKMALVDRRLSLAVDGVLCVNADLPEPEARSAVTTPVEFRAEGVAAKVHRFRLFRDVHYRQQGQHGIGRHVVRLEADQFFVLGDNSPDSEDSRFWPDEGRVPMSCLAGKPFLVHLPSRRLAFPGLGSCQVPDLPRIRWLP